MIAPALAPANPIYGVLDASLPVVDRWRCVMHEHGRGTVVATRRFAGTVCNLRVELDSGEDVWAIPCELRPVAELELVRS